MRGTQHRDRPQVITDARWSMSADISYRQRRYLIMMGIRLACFVIMVVVFVLHGRWLTVIPAVGAIALPYFAVVFANGGREPGGRERGFQAYQPNLPEVYVPPSGGHGPGGSADGHLGGPASPGSGPAPSDSTGNPGN